MGDKTRNSKFHCYAGAGSILISKEKSAIKITSSLRLGKVQDLGIANPLDMGSAMAPAAAHTIQQHFEDLKRSANDYDVIVTGDLSAIGTTDYETTVTGRRL